MTSPADPDLKGGHGLTAGTTITFTFSRTWGSSLDVQVFPLEEYLDPEQLPELTYSEIEDIIAKAHSEWLLELVGDNAGFTIGDDPDGAQG